MATVLSLHRCPTEQRRTAESSISQSKHTDRKPHENRTIMLVSQAYSHTHIHKHIHANMHIKSNKIYFATMHRLSFLQNSAMGIWWGNAPRAPNVETPLHSSKLI